MDDFDLLLTVVGSMIVAAIGVFLRIFGEATSCPSCYRAFAMWRTDETRSGEGLVAPDEEEYSCKYCGYSEWRKVEPDG